MKRVILKTTQSPGDVVMLAAAVRALKRALGAGVEIDVRTPCPALWEHNPHLTPLADGAGELIECQLPADPSEQYRAVAFHPRLHAVPRGAAGVASGKWLWFSCRHPLGFAP